MGPKRGVEPRWPGERLGLPAEGVGSVASGGRRLLALLLDFVAAAVITSLFIRPDLENTEIMVTFNYTSIVVWVVMTVPPAALFGFTPGMAALGVRVGRLDGAERLGWWRAVARCALTALLIPAVVRNADGRGLHDRATGTVVVRLR
ncbi:MAG: RDD family protein [Pseudonocardiaceae bacterium]